MHPLNACALLIDEYAKMIEAIISNAEDALFKKTPVKY